MNYGIKVTIAFNDKELMSTIYNNVSKIDYSYDSNGRPTIYFKSEIHDEYRLWNASDVQEFLAEPEIKQHETFGN